jgi:hypothetical protein
MGLSTFQEFWGRKGMFLCFCVSRKQACGHSLSVDLATHNILDTERGLLCGTDLINNNSFCDIFFSLMRIICHTQYIYLKIYIVLPGDMVAVL